MPGAPTPAVAALQRAKVAHTLHEYEVHDAEAGYGKAAAAALGVGEDRLFKTLLAEVDGKATVAIVPVAGQLDLKALAAAVKGKRAQMMDPAVAERRTGYVVGGISPFGQKQRAPTVVDASVLAQDTVYVSAGRRGLQVELAPASLVEVLGAVVAPIAR